MTFDKEAIVCMNGRECAFLMQAVTVTSSHALASHTVGTPGAKRFMREHVVFPFLLGRKMTGQAARDCLGGHGLTRDSVVAWFVGVSIDIDVRGFAR